MSANKSSSGSHKSQQALHVGPVWCTTNHYTRHTKGDQLPMQELVLDGDTSSLYYTARGLMQLQSLYGTIPEVKGKGGHALAVKNLLTLMRREMGLKAPRTGQT